MGEAKKVAALFAEIKVLRIFVSYNKQHKTMSNNCPLCNSPRPRRARVNDGYEGKVTFWEDQVDLALKGEGKYPLQRCLDSLKYFMKKRMEALAKQREAESEI